MAAIRPFFLSCSLVLLALLALSGTVRAVDFYEAEDATLSGPIVSTANAGYLGTGYADFQSNLGEFIEFTVDIPNGRFYSLSVRYANGLSADRPLELSVDGSPQNEYQFPSTNTWTNWQYSEGIAVYLAQGIHTVRITAATSVGPNVDQLRLDIIPDPEDTVEYEAEDALLVGPLVSTEHAGYSGTGYADYGTTLGEYVEWTVDAPVDGIYSLAFRYGNGSTTSRPLEASVDGMAGVGIDFPPTGAWTNWDTTLIIEIELTAGSHQIRATAATSIGPNVDLLILALLETFEMENQPPTAILLDNDTVLEESLGAVVGLLTTNDPDEGDEHAYTVSDLRFEVNAGVLSLAPGIALDHETEPTVSLDITSTDLGGLFITQNFVIQVVDQVAFSITVQAEDGALVGAQERTLTAGYLGDGYVEFEDGKGVSVTWVVDVPSAGLYDFSFVYATPRTSVMRLKVNGKNARAVPLQKRPNHSWAVWHETTVEADLKSGSNVITMEAIGHWRAFLDAMTISGQD